MKLIPSRRSVGMVLEELRGAKDLTYEDVAERAGLSIGVVWNASNGKVYPRLDTLIRLSVALGVKPNEIVLRAETIQTK